MTIEWGPIREHDGSAECPAEARDVPCMVRGNGGWLGRVDPRPGAKWTWKHVTSYRLPADAPAPAPAADPVRDALVGALEALNAACDAMWNDHERLEKNEGRFGQKYRLKECHVKAI